MKKYTFLLFFFIIIICLGAQTTIDLVEQIDFNLSLKEIALMVENGKSDEIDESKLIILDGIVSSREVLFADEENFIGVLELSYGEWEGLENVAIYKCYVQIQGLEFAPMIPVRRSRNPNPAEISLNTHILILGRYIGYTEDETGQKFPVLEGSKIRKIQ
jgi:hypothetical protein